MQKDYCNKCYTPSLALFLLLFCFLTYVFSVHILCCPYSSCTLFLHFELSLLFLNIHSVPCTVSSCPSYSFTVHLTLSLSFLLFHLLSHCPSYSFIVHLTLSLFTLLFHCSSYSHIVLLTLSLFILLFHCPPYSLIVDLSLTLYLSLLNVPVS